MAIVIFSLIGIILVFITVRYTLHRKTKCHSCLSQDVLRTGAKRYKEDPIAAFGSPNSYHELEYKCKKCGNVFWEPKEAIIFN